MKMPEKLYKGYRSVGARVSYRGDTGFHLVPLPSSRMRRERRLLGRPTSGAPPSPAPARRSIDAYAGKQEDEELFFGASPTSPHGQKHALIGWHPASLCKGRLERELTASMGILKALRFAVCYEVGCNAYTNYCCHKRSNIRRFHRNLRSRDCLRRKSFRARCISRQSRLAEEYLGRGSLRHTWPLYIRNFTMSQSAIEGSNR